MTDSKGAPTGAVDQFEVLFAGYVPPAVPWEVGTAGSVASTVAFLRDGDQLIVVDPRVRAQSGGIDPRSSAGVGHRGG